MNFDICLLARQHASYPDRASFMPKLGAGITWVSRRDDDTRSVVFFVLHGLCQTKKQVFLFT
jgi:hypothetical protein